MRWGGSQALRTCDFCSLLAFVTVYAFMYFSLCSTASGLQERMASQQLARKASTEAHAVQKAPKKSWIAGRPRAASASTSLHQYCTEAVTLRDPSRVSRSTPNSRGESISASFSPALALEGRLKVARNIRQIDSQVPLEAPRNPTRKSTCEPTCTQR